MLFDRDDGDDRSSDDLDLILILIFRKLKAMIVKHETRIRTLETKNKEQEKQLMSQVLVNLCPLLLLYQFTFAQTRPKSDISGALGPIHYVTLAFAMALGDGTKCETSFGGPRMILHAQCSLKKQLFQNRGLAFYYPLRPNPPFPGLAKDHTFSGFFLCTLP